MPRHGENIFKRKDGRWEGRYISSYNENGKAIYKSVYSKTYSDTKRKLNIAKSGNPSIRNSTINTFEELLDYWLEFNNSKNKQTTQNKYEFLIEKHIKPELGNVILNKISSVMINKFIETKTQYLSNSYVRTMAIIMKSALELGIKEQFVFMVNLDIHLPKQSKHELPILSVVEQNLLEEYILSHLDFISLGIYISLYAGLRIGEVCALKWSDIDFDNKIIKVRSTVIRVKDTNGKSYDDIGTAKTDASIRDIPIFNKLFIPLLKMKKLSKSPFVISTKMGFVNKRTFEYRYHKIMKNAGVTDVNFHALRHSFATRCIECGVDVKSLSEILGHSNVSVTLNTYVHSSMELKKIQIEKLNNLIA
ncbi:MAG: site-specific integrase [Clostridium sp.]|nr:site-specific integrase [Clostridium sp.]